MAWGLLLSLLAHILLALSLAKAPAKQFDTPVYVDIIMDRPAVPQREAPRKQLVSTPDSAPSKEPPPDTRFESERDTVTAKEQIKRGDELSGPAIGKEMPSPPKEAAPQQNQRPEKTEPRSRPAERPAEKRLSMQDLKLDSATLQDQFAIKPKETRSENPLEQNSAAALSSYSPFSRPFGSGARFLGNQGRNDYIPNLPDGDITLLNTKANLYAVFVRRVATQVFAQLRTEGWEVLRGPDIRAATEFAVVRATLSPTGDLLGVTLESSSGSARFDRLLSTSAERGARDPNPPKGALAADGNIHFIFESRSWVDVVPGGRTGMPTERRWVLLGTGLE